MASIKKRNNWTRPVSFARQSAVRKLADHVRADSAKALKLCSSTQSFDDALSELLDDLPENGPLEDLTDAERAFCAGWAYQARQRFGNNGQAICDAITKHIADNDTPWILSAGEVDAEVLNG